EGPERSSLLFQRPFSTHGNEVPSPPTPLPLLDGVRGAFCLGLGAITQVAPKRRSGGPENACGRPGGLVQFKDGRRHRQSHANRASPLRTYLPMPTCPACSSDLQADSSACSVCGTPVGSFAQLRTGPYQSWDSVLEAGRVLAGNYRVGEM